ncbi:MAG: hypothetical protein Q7T16_06065 [Candidatus Burarchaeum sp.]|nr:hypothetical protein [Candidatus Burarchaeum sp.]MDO8340193.1 hypothetical protein [Candidatus Burarchaeum sp.]
METSKTAGQYGAATEQQIEWLSKAREYLKENLLKNLQAGMQTFDPNFSFSKQDWQRLSDVTIKEFMAADAHFYFPDPSQAGFFYGKTEFGGFYDGSCINLSSKEIKSYFDMLRTITHEFFHYLQEIGGCPAEPHVSDPARQLLSVSFSEGSAEFLTQLALCQDAVFKRYMDAAAVNKNMAGQIEFAVPYPSETFCIYALLKTGTVSPTAFLDASLGYMHKAENTEFVGFEPGASFKTQITDSLGEKIFTQLFSPNKAKSPWTYDHAVDMVRLLYAALRKNGVNTYALEENAGSDLALFSKPFSSAQSSGSLFG